MRTAAGTEARTDSERDRKARRALMIEGAPVAALGLVALMLGSQPATTSAGKTGWALVSGLFVLAMAVVIYRATRRADEYQRKIQLESMAVGFGVVLVALQIAQFLEAVGVGNLRQSSQLIVVGGILVWQGVADLRTRLAR